MYFMCRNMSELQELQKIGVRTIGVEGCPMYLTVNRECYCKYEKKYLQFGLSASLSEKRKNYYSSI